MTARPRIYALQANIFQRHRWTVLALSIIFYSLVILVFGPFLRVSSNYLVAIPVIASALGFGFQGGLISGTLGLPANLLLFLIIGHPEFSPESKLIAQIFGMVVGSSLGALSEYFSDLQEQLAQGEMLTKELSRKINDKEILVQEVHHRVKNNLTLVLSLLQLQTGSATTPEFRDAMDTVSRRIRAIASVHDHIYTHEASTAVNLQRHIPELCRAVIDSHDIPGLNLQTDVQFQSGMSIQKATPLSLIVLEILTNSCKHAFSHEQEDPRIFLYGRETEEEFIIIISDNGRRRSQQELIPELEPADPADGGWPGMAHSGLGSTIIKSLTRQIRATLVVNREKGYEYVIKIRKPA